MSLLHRREILRFAIPEELRTFQKQDKSMNIQEKRILFADLDGTLIQTASGKTFAEECTDFRIRKDGLDKIR